MEERAEEGGELKATDLCSKPPLRRLPPRPPAPRDARLASSPPNNQRRQLSSSATSSKRATEAPTAANRYNKQSANKTMNKALDEEKEEEKEEEK